MPPGSKRGATWRVEDKSPGALLISLAGAIDEGFDAGFLAAEAHPVVVLDLDGVTAITSFGVRQWTAAMRALPAPVEHLYLVRCPPCFVYQLNSVVNFGGRAEVVSAAELAFCDPCQEEWPVAFDVLGDVDRLLAGDVPAPTCPTCGKPATFEEEPRRHFRFAATHAARALDPRAQALLRARGLVRDDAPAPSPPHGEKLVHGDVTLLRLAGTLDGRLRTRALTTGVEGDVVVDLGELQAVAEGGAERFRALLDELRPAVSLTLVDLPEALLAEHRGAAVFSLRLATPCPRCQRTTSASVPLAAGRSAVVPCASCGALLTRLLPEIPGRSPAARAPIRAAVLDVIARRHELVARAQAESRGGFALERYRVIRPIGRGGMAEVVLAVRHGLGGFEKLIALKKARRELLEKRAVAVDRFLDEARIAAHLSHPSIAQVFEVGEKDGELYIAMEYVHGLDALRLLRESVQRDLRLSIEQILFIGARVAAALHHAHTARDLAGQPLAIVHCDVSPSNIVVGYDGQVKLVDFGIARAATTRSDEAAWGKFSYMSPEQMRGEPIDGRSDVFSLGIVLHELLSGQSLFGGRKDAVLVLPIPPLGVHGVPRFVEEIVLRALARPLDERWADARVLQVALERALARMGSSYDAHQLSAYLRALFGDEVVSAPALTSTIAQRVP